FDMRVPAGQTTDLADVVPLDNNKGVQYVVNQQVYDEAVLAIKTANEAVLIIESAVEQVDDRIEILEQMIEDGTPGPRGPAGTIEVGSVTKGEEAQVTNEGTAQEAVVAIVLPMAE